MKFKFIKNTKIWFSMSAIAVAISLVGIFSYGLELGIDFTGGSLMEIQSEAGIDMKVTGDMVNDSYPGLFKEYVKTDQDTFIIQARHMSEDELQGVSDIIELENGEFELIRFTTIGPKIGSTLKSKAFTALIIALIAIVLYIAYAFRRVPKRVSPWKFGFCAIVALAHDIIITLGVFAILGFEVNAFFITALLTIMGFSVHDTIVVFDRIRENLKNQTRDDTFGDVADKSLNQTLTRSINTSISTLFPLVALYIWGAESIKIFIFALIIGIFVGTYSSIFIASPLLTYWQERKRSR